MMFYSRAVFIHERAYMKLYEFIPQGTLDYDTTLICADGLEEACRYYNSDGGVLEDIETLEDYWMLHYVYNNEGKDGKVYRGTTHVQVFEYEIKRGLLL
jgi:hypothetical protein